MDDFLGFIDFLGALCLFVGFIFIITLKKERITLNIKLFLLLFLLFSGGYYLLNSLYWFDLFIEFEPFEDFFELFNLGVLLFLINNLYNNSINKDLRLYNLSIIQREKLESLGILAGGLAHDFNNILMAIMGNAEILKMDSEISDANQEMIDGIISASKHGREITDQLRSLSNMKNDDTRAIINITELVRNISEFFVRGSKCIIDFEINSPYYVEMNEGQMSAAIQNIILNAVQAMPNGGRIKISSTINIEDQKITLLFKDNGVGISKENLLRIFHPFFTTKPKGTGLGSLMVQTIIKEHNGTIRIESVENQGTTVILEFPLAKEAPDNINTIPVLPQSIKGNILILEDQPEISSILMKILQNRGLHPVLTINGDETVKVFNEAYTQNIPFDCVILDKIIPGGKGANDICDLLRNIDPNIKLILSSGTIEIEEEVNFKKQGYNGVLKKPFGVAELNLVLDNIFLTK